jgi:hypothetical protein
MALNPKPPPHNLGYRHRIDRSRESAPLIDRDDRTARTPFEIPRGAAAPLPRDSHSVAPRTDGPTVPMGPDRDEARWPVGGVRRERMGREPNLVVRRLLLAQVHGGPVHPPPRKVVACAASSGRGRSGSGGVPVVLCFPRCCFPHISSAFSVPFAVRTDVAPLPTWMETWGAPGLIRGSSFGPNSLWSPFIC